MTELKNKFSLKTGNVLLKKALICVVSAVVLLVVSLLLFVYKGSDSVTFFQRQNINQYFASVPFEQDPGGNNILEPVAVACGTDGYPCDTFLGARNQIDYATGYVHVKVAVTEENEVILAQGFTDYTEDSVRLSRVIKQLNDEYEENGIVVELSEYSRLGALNAVLVNRGMESNFVITGVNENAVSYVKSFLPYIKVLCDYDSENRLSLEQIKQLGADGILCKNGVFNASLLDKARELGLLVWVDCENDVYSTVSALKFGADGIITQIPDFVISVGMTWSEDVFEDWVKNNKDLLQ